jgi:hypothetical protein
MPPTHDVTALRNGEIRTALDLSEREAADGPPPEAVDLEVVDVELQTDRLSAPEATVRTGGTAVINAKAKLLPDPPKGLYSFPDGDHIGVRAEVADALKPADLIVLPAGGGRLSSPFRVARIVQRNDPKNQLRLPEGLTTLVIVPGRDTMTVNDEHAIMNRRARESEERTRLWEQRRAASRREREALINQATEQFEAALRRAGIGDEEFNRRLRESDYDVSDADPLAQKLSELDEAGWDRVMGAIAAAVD